MKCAEVKKLLPAWRENDLNEADHARVAEHLQACSACQAELNSWDKYFEEMKSLTPVEAPPDFMLKLHERLERPSFWERIYSGFFPPRRAKLPWELATLAVSVMFAVGIFAYLQPNQDVSPHRQKTAPIIAVTPPAPEPQAVLNEEKPTPPKALAEKTAARSLAKKIIPSSQSKEQEAFPAQPEEKNQPAVIVAEIKKEDKMAAPLGASAAADKAEGALHKDREADERATQIVGDSVLAEPKGRKAEAVRMKAAAPRAPAPSALGFSAAMEATPPSSGELLPRIKELIAAAGGKVTEVMYNKTTGRPETVQAEIPARNYAGLKEKLEKLDGLKKPLPPAPSGQEENFSFRLDLIASP